MASIFRETASLYLLYLQFKFQHNWSKGCLAIHNNLGGPDFREHGVYLLNRAIFCSIGSCLHAIYQALEILT